MGAWDYDTFDNDTAGDWAFGLEAIADLSLVESALETVLSADYVESDDASEALAACEVVARLKGNWGKRDAYTEAVDTWVLAHPQQPSEALIGQCMTAIDAILQAEKSELAELWEGQDEWLKAVQNLRERVQS